MSWKPAGLGLERARLVVRKVVSKKAGHIAETVIFIRADKIVAGCDLSIVALVHPRNAERWGDRLGDRLSIVERIQHGVRTRCGMSTEILQLPPSRAALISSTRGRM